jgi:hypothetical protein
MWAHVSLPYIAIVVVKCTLQLSAHCVVIGDIVRYMVVHRSAMFYHVEEQKQVAERVKLSAIGVHEISIP